MQGFLTLNCIIGSQTLASVSSHLDDTLGIVIISTISLIVSLHANIRSHEDDELINWAIVDHILRVPRYTQVRDATSNIVSVSVSHYHSHRFESIAWIPSVLTFTIMFGVGGKPLTNAPPTVPVTPATIITFTTTTASSVISWCTMTPDYGVYHNAKVSSARIFVYTYLGFFYNLLATL